MAYIVFGAHQTADEFQFFANDLVRVELERRVRQQRNQDDPTAAFCNFDAGVDQRYVVSADEHCVHAVAIRDPIDGGDKIVLRQKKIVRRAQSLTCGVETVLVNIRRDDCWRAVRATHACQQSANRAGSQDRNRFARAQIGAARDVHAHRQRFDQTALRVRQMRRQVEHRFFWGDKIFAERALPICRAQNFFRWTKIDVAALTIFARAARPLWINDHAVADFEFFDRAADGDDIASRFVAQDHGRFAVRMCAVKRVDLGSAHADGFRAD